MNKALLLGLINNVKHHQEIHNKFWLKIIIFFTKLVFNARAFMEYKDSV